MSLTVFYRHYGYSPDQVKSLYFCSSALTASHPPLWFEFNAYLIKAQRKAKYAYPNEILTLPDIIYNIPAEHTLQKIRKDFMFDAWNFHHIMPNSNRHLLCAVDLTITYITDLVQVYHQHLKA